jgi:hypothetical protein
MFNREMLCRSLAAALLLSASTNLYADTFTISLTGVIELGEETFDNAFDLYEGNTVSAVGTFTADSDFLTALESTGTFSSLTINLNGTLFTLAGASAAPTVTFMDGTFFDFSYTSTATPGFQSSFQVFDNINYDETMIGTWTAAAVTAVPEAETYAMMLAGLGLVGFMGAARRKKLQAAA